MGLSTWLALVSRRAGDTRIFGPSNMLDSNLTPTEATRQGTQQKSHLRMVKTAENELSQPKWLLRSVDQVSAHSDCGFSIKHIIHVRESKSIELRNSKPVSPQRNRIASNRIILPHLPGKPG